MVHTSTAVVFGALALNAASALATPLNIESNEPLETRAAKAGKSTLSRVGSGLGTAAAFAPIAGLGLSLATGQPLRRDAEGDDHIEARDSEDEDHLEARAGKSGLRRVGSALGTAAGFAPLAALGLGMATGQPVRRDFEEALYARNVEDNEHLEARGKKSKSGGKKSTLSRVGSGLGKAAAFAPLAALGLSLFGGQPVRRDLLEELLARDVDDDHLEARAVKSGLRRVGSGLGTAAAFAPLAALGLGMATGQPVRRELIEELLARDTDDDDHLQARATKSGLRRVGSALGTAAAFAPLAALGLGMATGQPVRRDLSAELMDIFHREISESLEDLD
ncbi:hypothetical protein PLEOSDRAFT_154767 [Pleurotus ostreatus PC15]|uniref:Uncharacterized protein n=2 Tax=Pleurotus TaxID=5320 RepID=A0A067P2F6_PLEO1|nr:hypothetical protein CCMSSC00406_0010309 [Pleurotus cornucopiae]KDQ30056.1 hypothetical protein PLEOSDRAFT_154767 [Pleurotus ostreatus PC15]